MAEVCHVDRRGRRCHRAEWIRGGDVSNETLVQEDETHDDVEELLVEEVSIDGLCGVY
ncbi:MAG: mycofactocin precursor MftA [Acidobacteriota bacterium]|nr:mycofactocin precursor MftA [Acidobacteriota bacterium]